MTDGGLKLYFCDICNESIPLGDLKENAATTIRGKLFCRNCNPLNTLPAAKPAATGGASALLVVVLAVILGGLGYLGYRSLERDMGDREHAVTVLGDRQRKTEAALAAQTERADRLEKSGAARDRVEAVEAKQEQLAQLQEKNRQDVARLEDLIARMQGFQEKVTAVELQQQQLGTDVSNVRKDMENVFHQLDENMQRAITKLVAEGAGSRGAESPAGGVEPRGTAAPGGGGKTDEQATDAEAHKLIAQLGDKDSGVRWQALNGLALRHDRRFLPNIIPMIKDQDMFVQILAIGAVSELGAREAVKDLIAILRDTDPLVRREAMESLVRLTGNRDLAFKPDGPAEEREKGAKQWEEWYSKNKSQYEP